MDLGWLTTRLLEQASLHITGASPEPVAGGSINRAFRVPSDKGPLFIKVNAPSALRMFEAEARGLEVLAAARAVRVPEVLAVGAADAGAFLVLEWLEPGAKTPAAERDLGRSLARQHRVTRPAFGWDRDNTIGSTPQPNAPADGWVAFFRERRLRHQLDLAARNGLPSGLLARATRLLDELDALIGGHEPSPSLLHGDLWGGNWGATRAGVPYVFDPAVYFGDRETDLAMTRLFGGFGPSFYEAYETEWPLPPGSARRAEVYNLYHLLNHYNLFGAGYLGAVRAAVDRIEGR